MYRVCHVHAWWCRKKPHVCMTKFIQPTNMEYFLTWFSPIRKPSHNISAHFQILLCVYKARFLIYINCSIVAVYIAIAVSRAHGGESVCMKTGRGFVIHRWLMFEQMPNQWNCSQYCIHLLRKPMTTDLLLSVINGKLQLEHALAAKKAT